jgi:hypothetical protein
MFLAVHPLKLPWSEATDASIDRISCFVRYGRKHSVTDVCPSAIMLEPCIVFFMNTQYEMNIISRKEETEPL